jgi:hydroxymethylglutaryl-CoA lyase
VPNVNGARRAIDAGVDHVLLPISASVLHSRANVRKEPDEMIAELARIVEARDAAGAAMTIEGGIGTAFGCGIQGVVDPDEVLRLLNAALDAGADCVSLADTIGYAEPAGVRRLFAAARKIAGEKLWCGHFHDTRGLALANVCAALDAGVTRFDSSLAGIGGCPFAPGASGNVATEDLVFMLNSMGHETGIDLAALLEMRRFVENHLAGEQLYGTISRAGLPKTYVATARSAA